MTPTEYQEMLRRALESAKGWMAADVDAAIDNCMDPEGAAECHRVYTVIVNALSTPPPTNKLRPMKDAPRDGKPFLVYLPDLATPKVAIFVKRCPDRWQILDEAHNYDSAEMEGQFRGWLPLPQVSE